MKFSQLISAGLLTTALSLPFSGISNAADGSGAVNPYASGLRGSFELRTWVSEVELDIDVAGQRLTTNKDTRSVSTEFNYLLEDAERKFYFRGLAGVGMNFGGEFDNAYEADEKQRNAWFGYVGADLGWNVIRSDYVNLGPFIGAQMILDRFEGQVVNNQYTIRQTDWYFARVGIAGRGKIAGGLGWHAELAAIPLLYNETANVNSRNGFGAQAEAFLTYDVGNNWSLGLGARHWQLAADNKQLSGAKSELDYTRSGLLFESSYRF